eukprot:s532_g34.t1
MSEAICPGLFALLLAVLPEWPVLVAYAPRLLQGALASLADWAVYRSADRLGSPLTSWALSVQLTSWFQLYALPRTFSSSLEAVLAAWIVERSISSTRGSTVVCKWLLLLGSLQVAIRPTAAGFWLSWAIYKMSVLLQCGDLNGLFSGLLAPGLLISGVVLSFSTLLDCLYYGRFTVVPLNFLRFNLLADGSALYGSHPWHWYFTEGLAVTLGTFLPFCCIGLRAVGSGHPLRPLVFSASASILLISLASHKEYRFLCLGRPSLPLSFSDPRSVSNVHVPLGALSFTRNNLGLGDGGFGDADFGLGLGPTDMDFGDRRERDEGKGKGKGKSKDKGKEIREADPKQVFVANLGDAHEDDIRAFFEQAGDIERLKLLRNPDGSTKGVGFVTFRTEEQAQKALTFHNRPFEGGSIVVRLAHAGNKKGEKGEKGDGRGDRDRDGPGSFPGFRDRDRDDDHRDRMDRRPERSNGKGKGRGKGSKGTGDVDDALEDALSGHDGPLRLADFDFAARRFLGELRSRDRSDGGARFVEAMDMVLKYTSTKDRSSVRKWTAYVFTLLQKFDPALSEEIRERDQERRNKGAGRSRITRQTSDDD